MHLYVSIAGENRSVGEGAAPRRVKARGGDVGDRAEYDRARGHSSADVPHRRDERERDTRAPRSCAVAAPRDYERRRTRARLDRYSYTVFSLPDTGCAHFLLLAVPVCTSFSPSRFFPVDYWGSALGVGLFKVHVRRVSEMVRE